MNDTLVCIFVVSTACVGAWFLSPHAPRVTAARRSPVYFAAIIIRERALYLQKRVLSARRRERLDRELFDAIGYIRNIIAATGGARISADTLLEQLSHADGLLAPCFGRALNLLRVNRKEEMAIGFATEVGTPMARDFIHMLARWDEVSPEKLASTLLSYQNALREMRTTGLKRRNDVYSDLLYFPAVLNVLFVFMNFIFVSYYIEQRDLFEKLFF
jgi:hypothetical protein